MNTNWPKNALNWAKIYLKYARKGEEMRERKERENREKGMIEKIELKKLAKKTYLVII